MISGMAAEKERSGDGVTEEQVARLWRRTWALAIGGPLLVIAVVLVLLVSRVPLLSPSGEPAAWRTGAGFALSAVGFAFAGVGIYRMTRAGAYSPRLRTSPASFTREDRRDAVRLVRRGAPAPEGSMPVAAAMAEDVVRQGRVAPLYAGIALNGLGTALGTTGPWWVTLLGLSVTILMAFAIPLLGRDARLARRWLDTHPQPAAGAVYALRHHSGDRTVDGDDHIGKSSSWGGTRSGDGGSA